MLCGQCGAKIKLKRNATTTVIQFKDAYTHEELSGFGKVVTGCVHGGIAFFVRPASSDEVVVVASAASDAHTAIKPDDDVVDIPPSAVDTARLLMMLSHLLMLTTRDTTDVLPSPTVALN